MKILMLNYEYPPVGGGGGVIHQHIAQELATRHDVHVVTSQYGGLPNEEVVAGVHLHRVRVFGRNSQATASVTSMLSYVPSSIKVGQRLIDRIKPDIINTHFAVPTGPAGVILARRNRIPHALCIHGGDIFDPSKRLSPHRTPGLRQTVRWVLHRSDQVLAQSVNTAQNAVRIYGYTKEITIIPHGLKRIQFTPCARVELGLSDDQIVLVTVGRLVRRKANDQLIEILAKLNDCRVQLVIVGDGPEQKHLSSLAAELNVSQQVRFEGFVSEDRKYQLIQAADIFVSTTQHEGFGLMYVEAMFCGLPIVTYDHGGQSDFLEHDKTGGLIRLDDKQRFQEYLQCLIGDKSLRTRMGEHNRRLSVNFTVEHCASKYEQVFEKMADHQNVDPAVSAVS